MNYNNLPIVRYENSRLKLKNQIRKEGKESFPDYNCPYPEGSTFWKWWSEGFATEEQGAYGIY